jgi:hypothetical protein
MLVINALSNCQSDQEARFNSTFFEKRVAMPPKLKGDSKDLKYSWLILKTLSVGLPRLT